MLIIFQTIHFEVWLKFSFTYFTIWDMSTKTKNKN